MRKELEIIEQIEAYLAGGMGAEETQAFEAQMAQDPDLREEVELQRELMEGIDRLALKQSVQKAYKQYQWKQTLASWGIGAAIALVVVGGALLGLQWFQSEPVATPTVATTPLLNENGDSLYADADKYLPSQQYVVDNTKDTLLETDEGMIIIIPDSAFIDDQGKPVDGPVELEVKEALTPADILKAGLTTKSGHNTLETGGMFYINARKHGKQVAIDPKKAIFTHVPSHEIQPGMQLWDGQRMSDGSIDWVNPQALETFLTPVDIFSLNLYPPDYQEGLANLGYDPENKRFADSLYYSFSAFVGEETPKDEPKDTVSFTLSYAGSVSTGSPDEPVTWMVRTEKVMDSVYDVFLTATIADGWNITSVVEPTDGGLPPTTIAFLPNKDYHLTGGMAAPPHHLRTDIKFDKALSYYKKEAIFNQVVKVHHFDARINIKVQHTAFNEKGFREPTIVTLSLAFPDKMEMGRDSLPLDDLMDGEGAETFYYGVDPAKVKAIWNKQFQGTLLATKAFESRMAYIHRTCSNNILDLYAHHLDKRMAEIDQMAADQLSGELQQEFQAFADRNDGRVELKNRYAKVLQYYYEQKANAYHEAIKKTHDSYWQKQAELDREAVQRQTQAQVQDLQVANQNFQEEFETNLKETYEQLGLKLPKEKSKQPLIGSSKGYNATITDLGWKNIDRIVFEQTANRETIDITKDGKRAVIQYEPIAVEIKAQATFDRLYVYLLPDQLNSYMRMKLNGTKYEEKLNELMQYELVCLGWKGDQAYYFNKKKIKPGNNYNFVLDALSDAKLEQALFNIKQRGKTQQLLQEVARQQFEWKNQQRQQKNVALMKLREQIRPDVFPCAVVLEEF